MKYYISKLMFIMSLILFSGVSNSYAKLYVTDAGVGAVAVYNNTDDGNVPAQQTISGPNTAAQTPVGIAVDADYIYVTQYSSNSVTVYNQNADGNVPPIRNISGASTLLSSPHDLAIDSNFIYVVNMEGNSTNYYSINVYNLTDTGNVTPVRTIYGDQTSLGSSGQGGPGGVAVDANYIYVVRPATDAILVYDINADGNVAPVRTITGNMDGPYGIDVDEKNIYVGNINGNSITVYNLTDTGNVTPVRTITGNLTTLSNTIGIAVDGEFIYAANGNGQNIPVFNLTDNGNIAPVRSITGFTAPDKIAVYSACIPPPANLVSWWRAEGDANDTMGTNNGTLHNGTTFTTGKVGQGFSFDDIDDYIVIANGIVPKTARDFTLEAWVYLESLDATDGRMILYGGSTGGEYELNVTSAGNYGFGVNLANSGWRKLSFPAALQTWTHIVATRRGGSSIELWINGVKQSEDTIPDEDLRGVTDGMNNSRIGAYNEYTTLHKSYWHGLIDEVDIFSKALSPEEIAAIYNAGSGGKCFAFSNPFPWTMFLPAITGRTK
ncbi:MAG: LamG-like jellyroll fold domain-containing protein [Desulfocapsaceae bacterium]|nr:LamG-like jellyroll fold domain-containing protein [Desulfocapsaceae bacterium]